MRHVVGSRNVIVALMAGKFKSMPNVPIHTLTPSSSSSSSSNALRRAFSTAFAYLLPLSAAGCGDPGEGYSGNGRIRIESLTSDVGTLYGPSASGPPPEGTVTFYAFVRARPTRTIPGSPGRPGSRNRAPIAPTPGTTIPGGEIGGGVLTDEAGHTYAAFHGYGSGIYTATLGWSQIHRVKPIDAGRPGTPRRFVAKFYDISSSINDDGNVATMDIDIQLSCGDQLDVCNGICKESCS